MKKILIGLTLGLGLLTACAPMPPPADNYTGGATVTQASRYGSGSKAGCEIAFTTTTGKKYTQKLGKHTTCGAWTPGRNITLTKGIVQQH